MRHFMLAAAALAASSPALAQSTDRSRQLSDEIARSLPHPYDVEAAGDRVQDAVGALMNVPIGGVVRSIDPAARVRPGDTIADVAGRDDPDFRERTRDQVAGLTLGMADLMRHLAVVAPVLGRSLGDLERNLERAVRDVERR